MWRSFQKSSAKTLAEAAILLTDVAVGATAAFGALLPPFLSAPPAPEDPSVESLEGRQLMSAAVLDGVLTIRSTGESDLVEIRESDGRVIVGINSESESFPTSEVESVQVIAKAGDDRVVVTGRPPAAPVLVYGGAGMDRVRGAVNLRVRHPSSPGGQDVNPPQTETDRAVLRPADFGAVGDGRADDAPALQRAIDSAPAGAVLRLDPLVYRLSAGLVIQKPIVLDGNGATLLLDTSDWPKNNAITIMSRLSATTQTFEQQIVAGQSTFQVSASGLRVGDDVFLELGQDEHDGSEQHFASLARVVARTDTSVTLDVQAPYDIRAGRLGNRITRVDSLAQDVAVRNVRFDNPPGRVIDASVSIFAARNVLIDGVRGRFTNLLNVADSQGVTLRDVRGELHRDHPAAGRLVTAWQSEAVLVADARVSTNADAPVVFAESHNRGLVLRDVQIDWLHDAPSAADVLHLTGGSTGTYADRLLVRNAHPVNLVLNGGQPSKYALGRVEVTGPVHALPLDTVAELTLQGVRYGPTQHVHKTIALSGGWTDHWIPLGTGAAKSFELHLSEGAALSHAFVLNADGQGFDAGPALAKGAVSLSAMIGADTPLNDRNTQWMLRLYTGPTMLPGGTLTVDFAYYL